MRKLLALTLSCTLLASAAGWGAGLQGQLAATPRGASASGSGAAAVHLPAKLPTEDQAFSGMYGYRSSDALARRMGAGRATDGAAGGSVTITAMVLPTRTIVVEGGRVTEIWSNTTDLRAGDSLYAVRSGRLTGPLVALTPGIWGQVRQLMLAADAATGRVA